MKPSGAGGRAGFRQHGDLSETENTYKSRFPQLKLDTTVQASMIKYECTHQRFRAFSVNPARNVGKIRQADHSDRILSGFIVDGLTLVDLAAAAAAATQRNVY